MMTHQITKVDKLVAKVFQLLVIIVALGGHNELVAGHFSSVARQQDFGGAGNVGGGATPNGVVGNNGGSVEIVAPKSLPLLAGEPSCEELRAMWRFSKRQSRAAEMTNDIPTYRDPFAYNVWDPNYPTTRSMGGMRILPRYRDSTRPVYGRVIHREPMIASRIAERNRALEDFSRLYGAENKAGADARRRIQFRFSGGVGNSGGGANSLTAHQGSFQKLKELIWTERAKDLAQQRRTEEMEARAAALKDIANGQSYGSDRRQQMQSDSPLMDENRSPDQNRYRHHNNEGRSSLTGGQTTSIFSSNPASNSARSRGLLLPSMGGSLQGASSGSSGVTKNFPMRPSHFRERNRALIRQTTTPSDYFQRDARNILNNGIYGYLGEADNDIDTVDTDDLPTANLSGDPDQADPNRSDEAAATAYAYEHDLQLLDFQEQLKDLYSKLYQHQLQSKPKTDANPTGFENINNLVY